MELKAPINNIINSDEWGDDEWLQYFKNRWQDMKAKKQPFSDKFTEYEIRETAISFYDNSGSLQVNVPLEQNLIEIYMGRTNGRILFDIIPDGQANVEELQPTKFALNFFLDGNYKDNFWKENKIFRHQKALYGTGIFYTGIRSYKDYRYKIKKGSEIENGTDLLNKNKFDKITNETWFFFPKAIHPKDFYIDDNAYGQTDIQYADDCIWKEKLSFLELKMRYGENKAFINIDKITSGIDTEPKNINDKSINNDELILYHYFNRITKKHIIVANEITLIYNGLYLYDDGKLPFEMVQHYTNPNCIWGRGIPERVGYLKSYKSEILQDMLVGAEMSSGLHLITGNDDEIGQDWTVGGRGINIWRTTSGAQGVQQINTSPNLSYFSAVLNILDDLVVQDTGDNVRAPIDMQSDKVGIVEIMEANKAVRQSSVDENYNLGLDSALTMTLSRIRQFAPSLLSEKILDSDGKTLKIIFPKIRIDGYTVTKEDGKQIITQNIGKYGYFELKPEIVQGVGVKIITSSTNSMLPILERGRISEYFDNIVKIANLANINPKIAEELQQVPFNELIGWVNDTYGFDNKLKANTEKDKLILENKEKLKKVQQFLMGKQDNILPNQGNNENIGENKELGQSKTNVGQSGSELGITLGGIPKI